jgi:predicted aspartyl protease
LRTAIAAWQRDNDREPTGLLGESDSRALRQEVTRGVGTAPDTALRLPSSRDEIPLTPEGKLFVVPARINDAISLPFILDSGASDVQIPVDVVTTLARAGTISDTDLRETQTCTLADGSRVRCDELMLRELRLGNHIVRNVVASIGPPKSELLLGQSFLSRFGVWAIDNTRHVLILGSPDEDQRNLRGAPA